MKDLKDFQFTRGRVLIGLAVLTAIGWLWAAVDSNIPVLIFFLFGVAAPIALFILSLSWVLGGNESYDDAV